MISYQPLWDTMKKKQDDPAVHDLRDHPVPPVKGAITDRGDAVIRPESRTMGSKSTFETME